MALDAPCFDVRSPQEFSHACIPEAINLALFNDRERAEVGTCYKHVGKKEAIELGVKIVGPKLFSLLQDADQVVINKCCKVYCWRGGMRSGFLRFFLEFVGYKTAQLQGGYKAFRRRMLAELEKRVPLVVIGGMTGSGKTELLSALQDLGEEIIDLENIARHRGSVYGELLGVLQPSCEQFENELALKLYQLKKRGTVWVEHESRLIGSCTIPNSFFMAMRKAPLIVIECPEEERIFRIIKLYGSFDKAWWIQNTQKIQRKLGATRTETVIRHIEQGFLVDAIRLLLPYYDESYRFSMQKHEGPIISLPHSRTSAKSLKEIMDANSQSIHSVC